MFNLRLPEDWRVPFSAVFAVRRASVPNLVRTSRECIHKRNSVHSPRAVARNPFLQF